VVMQEKTRADADRWKCWKPSRPGPSCGTAARTRGGSGAAPASPAGHSRGRSALGTRYPDPSACPRAPTVAILSTGDELCEVSEEREGGSWTPMGLR